MAFWWLVGLAWPRSSDWRWSSAWCQRRSVRSKTTLQASSTPSWASSTPCCWRSWSSQPGKNSGVPALRWKPRPTPSMERSEESSRSWVLIDDIRASLQEVEPTTVAGQELYAEGLDQVQRLADARRMRLVMAEESLPTVLWVVLIVGGIVAVGFAYLFGLQNTWAHALMVGSLAGVIALMLFTIAAMDHPFSGAARVGPEAFELVLKRFETSKLSDL